MKTILISRVMTGTLLGPMAGADDTAADQADEKAIWQAVTVAQGLSRLRGMAWLPAGRNP